MRYVVLLVVLAGCLSAPGPTDDPAADAPDTAPFEHRFDFQDPAVVLAGAPGYSIGALGEPMVEIAPDGTRFVGMIGCDEGLLLGSEQDWCHHTPVLRSADGRDWQLLNRGPDRRLDDGPRANGDIDLQWLDGSLHALLLGPSGDLGSAAMHHVSHDGGQNWDHMGAVGGSGVDRQWLFANQTHLFATYLKDGSLPVFRLDGEQWVRVGAMDPGPDASVGPQGPPVYGAVCDCFWAAVHATESTSGGLVSGDLPGEQVKLLMMRSDDGAVWSIEHEVIVAEDGLQGAAPWQEPVAEDAQGGVWTAYVVPEGPPGAPTGTALHLLHGDPEGRWTSSRAEAPVNVAMPTLAPGSPPLLAFLGSSVPGDSGRVGQWSLYAGAVDGSIVPAVIDADVHHGGICSEGLFCILEAGDRALFDYISAATLPDGRYVVTYTADPVTGGKATEVRYIEESGPP